MEQMDSKSKQMPQIKIVQKSKNGDRKKNSE